MNLEVCVISCRNWTSLDPEVVTLAVWEDVPVAAASLLYFHILSCFSRKHPGYFAVLPAVASLEFVLAASQGR